MPAPFHPFGRWMKFQWTYSGHRDRTVLFLLQDTTLFCFYTSWLSLQGETEIRRVEVSRIANCVLHKDFIIIVFPGIIEPSRLFSLQNDSHTTNKKGPFLSVQRLF
ncbi:hypothetical protein CEXT_310661 [Caerostris extrusa]|uniref:Maturase K n=1 Tax=Caerostris extrusa TaxID=172846 RepID=A0AAV4MRB7_CAEEX|nr:hypothetical protein CEXT_310661 [Caerostris extrusa]